MVRTANILCAFLGLLLLGVSIYVQFLTSDYGDKQWEMLYAQKLLAGKRLYSDMFTVSPPLIYWMFALPAAMAKLSGTVSAFAMLVIVGLAVIAISIFLCTRLITRHPGFAGNKARPAQFAALLAFVLIFRTSPLFFLDREHLFFVLILPYMVRFMPSLSGIVLSRRMRISIGVLAGIGFCIKPYCLVVWAGIQLLYALSQRSLGILISIENILIYAIGLFYLLLVELLYPEFYSVVVPMAMVSYSATRDPTPVINYCTGALFILVLTFLMFRLRYNSPYRRDIIYLAGLCPFFLFYALMNNNWAYVYLPLVSTALILTGLVLWEFLYFRREFAARGLPTWQFTLGAALCLANFAIKIAVSVHYFDDVFKDTCRSNIACLNNDKVAAEVLPPGSARPLSFGAVSIEFGRWTKLEYYTGAPWVTRFSQLWMLPKFLISDKQFERDHRWILTYVAEAFADDMNHNKPAIMFVDDADVFYTAVVHIDLVHFFSANRDFAQAFTHYEFVHNINLCSEPGEKPPRYKVKCSYEVYRRKD